MADSGKKKIKRYWTEAKNREVAKRYSTLRDFFTHDYAAYQAAVIHKWIDNYTWLKRSRRDNWTEESVLEESKKYCCSDEFYENCQSGWRYAKRTGAFKKITWFIKITPEFKKWMNSLQVSVFHLLTSVGLSATKQWLFIESGKTDVYTEDQCKLLKRWSEIVTENWAAWKKFKWYLYDDMNYEKRRLKGDKEEDMDDGLHIKP